MGKKALVAYEDRRKTPHEVTEAPGALQWHKVPDKRYLGVIGARLEARGNAGIYVLAHQRHGWAVDVGGSLLQRPGHDDWPWWPTADAAKAAASQFDRKVPKPFVETPAGAECPPARGENSYRRQVADCLKALGRTDPMNDVEKSKDYIDHAEKAGVDPKTTAAIVDATLGHAHLKQSTFVAGASESNEEASSALQWHKAPDRFDGVIGARLMAKGNAGTLVLAHQRHGWVVSIGGSLLRRPGHDDWPYWPTAESAKKAASDFDRRVTKPFVEDLGAAESPTRDEWQIIVTNPPANSRGAILSYVGPGEAYTVGRAIVLGGFYDDVEAQHVARSITEKYGATVTYGPKSTFGVSETAKTAPAVAEEDCGCTHVDELAPPVAAEEKVKEGTICRPFTRIERDPREFEMCMKRAAEIGPITNSKAIYELVYPDISRLDEEHFFVIMMDFRGQLRDYVRVALGQRHSVRTDVRDVTAAVLLSKCDGYALVHCHPSGHAEPSQADRQLTAAIRKSIDVVCTSQVVFVDHVVVGLSSYFSFADKKLHRVK